VNTNKNIKVIISGGGTGGHIFPAIAIAKALKKIKDKTYGECEECGEYEE
jgi:UDP-N-acetylglucosamine--N-acetylmuramyl-(pentapeptide) pyrophosphoryl-undecaprenol N-acetylglucosamine transferase